MIAVQKCDARRRSAVYEVRGAARGDVESRRIGGGLGAPLERFTRVGAPIDVRTGKEVGTLVVVIHEFEAWPRGSANCISSCEFPARTADRDWESNRLNF